MSRQGDGYGVQALDHTELQKYLCDTARLMRELLASGARLVIEGTQGFGLSILHGGFYPKATSRDTVASAFVAEAGLSPLDVDEVVLVIRTFPIRVAGNSGKLPRETSWRDIATRGGLPQDFHEITTVTKKIRRVGEFDPTIVRRAIAVNWPTSIVLNHLDYVDYAVRDGRITSKALAFVTHTEREIGRRIDWLGTGPDELVDRLSNRVEA